MKEYPTELPPYLASELSSRLIAVDPQLRRLFALEDIPISGADFEKLLCAIWLAGYGDALGDLSETMSKRAQDALTLPPLALWIMEHMA